MSAENKQRPSKLALPLAIALVLIIAVLVLTFVIGENRQKAINAYEIQLYFSDGKYTSLVPERRIIEIPEVRNFEDWPKPIYETILNELIKGPTRPDLRPTIPEGTRLLSVSVESGIAYVNFSKEIKTNHWGGSGREGQTVDSLFLSLIQVPRIEKVQLLIEGEKTETLAGHVGIDKPISKPITPESVKQ